MLDLSDEKLLNFIRLIIPICFVFFVTSFGTIMFHLSVWADNTNNYSMSYVWNHIRFRVYCSYFYFICLLISVFSYIYLTTN